MKALVTGGAGFIGRNLVHHLLENDYTVTVLDDFSSGSVENIREFFNNNNFLLEQGDVRDYEIVRECMRDADVVFHLSAQINVEESIIDPATSFEINTEGTLNILEAGRRFRPKMIIYASSTEVYGTAQMDPMPESHPFNPQSPYAAGKAAADRLCSAYHHTYGLPVAIIRQFNTYGPYQRFKGYSAVIPIFVNQVLNRRPPTVFGDGTQSRDFHYITDLMYGYDLMLDRLDGLNGKTINFGTGVATSVNELADMIVNICVEKYGWSEEVKKEIQPVHLAPRPGEVHKFSADITLAKEILGFSPRVSLEEGLSMYIDWFRAEHQGEFSK